MARQAIVPQGYPDMALPFSPAIKTDQLVFVSGYSGVRDPQTGEKVREIKAQTRQTLDEIKRILEAAGSSLDKVLKVTVFLRNAEDFDQMNEVYRTYFRQEPPARSTVVTDLVYRSMLVEIECVAMA